MIRVLMYGTLLSIVLPFVALADHGGSTHANFSLNVPSTSSTGNYTVTWSAGTLNVTLEEKFNGGGYVTAYYGSANTFSFANKPAGTYTYRIFFEFCYFSCTEAYSAPQSIVVSAGPPSVPGAIQGPTTDDDGIFSLSWGSSAGAVAYDVERRVGGGAWFAQTVTTNSVNESGLTSGSWDYRVRACSSAGCSGYTALHTIVVTIPGGSPNPPPPVPGTGGDPGASLDSDQTGTTSGSFRVDESGSATYSVPIAVAAGTAGVKPSISLNYSSGSGNGIAGMGWSLGGMSAITRCKQTYDQDRNPQPITWTNVDRFCLDGHRLLLENPSQTYGAANTTYRTEVDNGAIVTARGSVSGEPDYFEVKRKDGSTRYYGKSPNDASNVSAKKGGSNGKTLLWGIRQFEDNIGNPIWFDYDNDADGQRIKTIYWAFGLGRGPVSGHGARLEFVYENRDDDRVGYVNGVELTTKKRLSQVKSYNVIGVATLMREYTLRYNEGISTNDDVSRLTSVQECAGTACLPKTIFDWRVPSSSAFVSQLSTRTLAESSNLSDLTLADVNGDGLMDLVWFEGTGSNTILNFATSNGSSLTQKPFTNGSLEYNVTGNGEKLTPIDYNLDGRYDIAYWDDSISRWRVILSAPMTDGTWRLKSSTLLTPIDNEDVSFVDIDSNGTTDAIWLETGFGARQLKRSLLQANASQPTSSDSYYYFGTPTNVGSPSVQTVGQLHAVAADFDGDGRIGLIVGRDMPDCEYEFNPPQCFGNGYASLLNIVDPTSASPSYSQYAHLNQLPSMWQNEHAKVSSTVVTDVNADGLSDLFFPVYRDPNVNMNEFHLAINKGDGTFDVRQEVNSTIKATGVQRAQFVDWNGDGHADLMWKDTTNGGSVKIRYWDASINGLGSILTVTTAVSTSTNESVYFPDLNGDGVPDMLKIDTSTGQGTVTMYTRKVGTTVANRASNRIEKITNGIGAETSITYEPLSYSDHYERMEVDTTPSAPGGGLEHCIWRSGEPICVNEPVTAPSAGAFYSKINGAWEIPSDSHALNKSSPVIEVAGPMYVVTDVVGSAPAAVLATPGSVNTNATSALEYHYYEAKVQAAGRGFLGFQQLKTVDTISGVKTTTQYRQDWPFNGLPIGTVVSSSSNVVIGGSSSTWKILEWATGMPGTAETSGTAALGPIHVETTSATANTYDLVNNGASSGALLSTVTTTTLYDAEANAISTVATTRNHVTQQDELIVTTTNTYNSSTFNLWLGRLTRTSTVTNRPSVSGSTTRVSDFTYYTSGAKFGMLHKEIIEPGHVDFELTTTHYYDAHGNRNKTTISDGTTTRCSTPSATSVYDSSGRYVDRTYDCLGRWTTEVVSRNGFGQPTQVDTILDATTTTSRATTNIYYGAMGREYYRSSEDGSFKTTYFSTSSTNCPSGTSYKVTEYTAGGGTSAVCFDPLARETRKLTLGFDGTWDAQDTNYDSKGRTLHKSEPYDLANGAAYWSSLEYDLFDRVTKTTMPDSSWSQTAYAGFKSTTTISHESQTRTEKRNALGDVIEAVDNLGGTAKFTFDNLGNLATSTDPAGNVTTTVHNALGQKNSMRVPHSNPAMGMWTYEFNHFGELEKQTNGNGHTSEMTYDGLGRLKTRVDKFNGTNIEGSTTWTYDTSPDGLGKLDSVLDGQSGFTRAVLYDSLGRVDEVVTSFDSRTFYEKTTYDSYGRVYQFFDAAGDGSFTDHGVQNQYGYYGHLQAVADAVEVGGAPRVTYRQVVSMNARGQVTKERLGVDPNDNAAVESDFFYYAATGRMKDIEAKDSNGAFVQDLYYEWNDAGSLTKRQDTYHGGASPNTLTEVFGYDGLNRLTSHGELGQAALSVTYDAIGNIKTKTGITGTYTYGSNAGPNAVTNVNGSNYYYDDNGNNISGGGRTLVYSTFDKPTSIAKGGNTVTFAYNTDRARYRRVDQGSGGTTTTRYIGNVEIIDRPNGTKERKRYIAGIAIETGYFNAGGTETSRETLYTLKDHLGSLDVIVDDAGLIDQKMSFGPWGQRRDATNWQELDASNQIIDLGSTFDTSRTTRGFTGHEMLDSVGIVHMNGRIFDPFLGRFLQSDNYVQDPTNTQSHNRYSYVWNNPLNATDPSGEFVFTLIATLVTAAAKGALDAWVVGLIFGVAGTLDALMAGADIGDAFLVGVVSGVSAGAFSKAGKVLEKFRGELGSAFLPVKAAAYGTIGGVTSVVRGGKFGHGFVSGVSGAITASVNGAESSGKWDFSWGRVGVSAAVSGTASKITGGKFANGAASGAFSSIAMQGYKSGAFGKIRSWLSKTFAPDHYARNQINEANLRRMGLWGRTDLDDQLLIDSGFSRSSYTRKVFHDNSAGNEGNQRWSYKDELFGADDPFIGTEIVVDSLGRHVMDQPINMASFNYSVTGTILGDFGHLLKDMVPFFLFGNNSSDPSNIFQRLWRNTEMPRRHILETPGAYGQ